MRTIIRLLVAVSAIVLSALTTHSQSAEVITAHLPLVAWSG